MRLLLTAGPTREAIDPVRYITNRSSGKMGHALAEAAVSKGHEVILISGPVALAPPAGLAEFVAVESAREMFEAVRDRIGKCDAAIFCAAVADYRPRRIAERKIKKTGDTLTLELEKTEDILGGARTVFGFAGVLVGFAAETDNLDANARAKLERKDCDLLVANDVSRRDIGFDSGENEVRLFYRDGRVEDPPMGAKSAIAERLIRIVETLAAQQG